MTNIFTVIVILALIISTGLAVFSMVLGGSIVINLMTLALNVFTTYNLLHFHDFI